MKYEFLDQFLQRLTLASIVALLAGVAVSAHPAEPGLDAATRTQVIEGAIKQLNNNYVFPEVASEMEKSVRARLARGEYDAVSDPSVFAQTLTAHLREVSKDKHLRVVYTREANRFGTPGRRPGETPRSLNFGFERVERLAGNIGYLDLRGFNYRASEAAETVAAAMNFLANTEALIIDLRYNGGGDPEMVAHISSYLFDKPTHLNDIYDRPSNSTRSFHTSATVPGKRYLDRDVYILTSQRTFSAAEEFTYNLKNLKRAVIVGETTGGGAHPTSFQRINDHFGIGVPSARAINPITKTNWEGVGVKPDVEAPAAQALEKAMEIARTRLAERNTPQSNAKQTTAASGAADPAVKLPETPAGRTIAEFVKALNSGNLETMKKFHSDRNGDPGNAEQDLGFYQRSGGIRIHRVNSSTETKISVLIQTVKDGNWLDFEMEVDGATPPAPISIRVQQGSAPAK